MAGWDQLFLPTFSSTGNLRLWLSWMSGRIWGIGYFQLKGFIGYIPYVHELEPPKS